MQVNRSELRRARDKRSVCIGSYYRHPLLWTSISELRETAEMKSQHPRDSNNHLLPPTTAGELLGSVKTRGRFHSLEPPQIGAAREAGGGRAARRPEDPGPRPLWRPERTGRAARPAPTPPKSALSAGSHDPGASRPAAAAPATSTLVPTSGARAPGPGNTARHSARAHAWPSPGRCGRSR